MPCLILDTSTDLSIVALANENGITSHEVFKHANLLSKNLLPAAQALLQKNGLAPSDLTSIAVGIGPGSYTGTRLGVAVAKSLAFALNVPIKAFCSPLAFIPDNQGTFAFIIPARSGNYFLVKGMLDTDYTHFSSAGLIPPEKLAAEIGDAGHLIFSACENFPDALKEKPRLEPSLNLSVLWQFLLATEPTDPENMELHYLHTP